MPLHSLPEPRTEVLKKIPRHIIASMLAYLKSSTISLQGSGQGDNYLETMLLLQLYKDTRKLGYDALEAECKNHLLAPHTTVRTNIRRVRAVLALWADSHIVLGSAAEWKAAAANVPYKIEGKGEALVWVDTFDGRIKGRFTVSKKDPLQAQLPRPAVDDV